MNSLSKILKLQSHSGRQPHWVSWEEGGLADVLQVAEEFHDSFETEASSSVVGGSIFERFDVALNRLWLDAFLYGLLCKQLWFVDSLCTGCDFLTSHEEIVRVCVVRVIRIRHGVECSSSSWEPVENIEVGVVFLFDDGSKRLLILCTQVGKVFLLYSRFSEEGYTFLEV